MGEQEVKREIIDSDVFVGFLAEASRTMERAMGQVSAPAYSRKSLLLPSSSFFGVAQEPYNALLTTCVTRFTNAYYRHDMVRRDAVMP